VLALLGVKHGTHAEEGRRTDQGIGEYCKGADVEECMRYFGEAGLEAVCATCPQ